MTASAKQLRTFYWGLFLVSSLFFGFWLTVSYPYYLLPSDEVYYLTAHPLSTHYPVFVLVAHVAQRIWGLFSPDILSSLVFLTALCQAGLFFVLGYWAFKLTKSYRAPILCLLFFGASPWMAKYFFWASYTPLATLFFVSSLYLLWRASLGRSATPQKEGIWIAIAGALCAAGVLSSASGALMAILQIGFLFFLFPAKKHKQPKEKLIWFLMGGTAVVLPFAFWWLPIIGDYWWQNIHTWHYARAMQTHGFVPRPPFFSFIRIGMVDEPALFAAFIGFSLWIVHQFGMKKRRTEPYRSLALLFGLVWVHALAVDLSPFTKLGRTHYVVYPIAILCTVCAFVFYFTLVGGDKAKRRLCWLGLCLVLGFTFARNALTNVQIYQAKQLAPQYLRKFPPTQFYALRSDPHAQMIQRWSGLPIQLIESPKEIVKSPDRQSALILGPSGEGSGKSVLHDGNAKDFKVPPFDTSNAIVKRLPYYSSLPTFLMEEEIVQAFFFMGSVPRNLSDEAGLTIWIWK